MQLLECRSSAGGGHTVKDTGERGYGYCVDTKPDSKIYQVTKSLFISSQDGAYNHEELIEKKITHILNVASGIKNAFPQVKSKRRVIFIGGGMFSVVNLHAY